MEAKPGDVIWLPEGTPLKYEGRQGRRVLRDPVDWRQRHGMA
jgi:hypothetical protein